MLEGKIAIVTGGAQGIGFAVASLLHERGAHVVSWDIDPGNGDAMAGLSGDGLAVECDISDLASVEAAYALTCKTVGIPSILVNSAGIAGPNAPMDSYGIEDWHRVMDINLNGTFYVNRVCVPGMKEAGYGRILNVASIAGKEGNRMRFGLLGVEGGRHRPDEITWQGTGGFRHRRQLRHAGRRQDPHLRPDERRTYRLHAVQDSRGRFLDVEEAAKLIVWATFHRRILHHWRGVRPVGWTRNLLGIYGVATPDAMKLTQAAARSQ